MFDTEDWKTWNKSQKLRWFWGWMATGLFYLIFSVLSIIFFRYVVVIEDEHVVAVIVLTTSLPPAGLIGYLFHQTVLARKFPDK